MRLNLRSKFLISFVALIIGVSLLIGMLSYYKTKNSLIDNTIHSSQYITEQIAVSLQAAETELTDYLYAQTIRFDIGSLIRIRRDEYDTQSQMKAFLTTTCNMKKQMRSIAINDNFGRIYLYTKDEIQHVDNTFGTFYANNNVGETKKQFAYINERKREFIKQSFGNSVWEKGEDGQLYMYRAIVDPESMQFVGIIAVEMADSYISDQYKNTYNMVSGRVVVLNRENESISSYDEFSEAATEYMLARHKENENEATSIVFQQTPIIFANYKCPTNEWTVVNIITMEDLMAQTNVIKWWITFACIIAVLVASIVAAFLSGNITSNIRRFIYEIKRFSKGHFHARINVIPTDEVGLIAIEFNEMAQRIDELINTVYQEQLKTQNVQIKALEFEYSALQSQINPHFLYNTLEGINCLAKIKGEDEISEMIFLLERLMRESIDIKETTVQLQKEIDYIGYYLDIQKFLFGEKISVQYHMNKPLLTAKVPKFILQPIVENAIHHGIEPEIGPGIIEIIVKQEGDFLFINVTDNGVGMTEELLEKIFEEKESAESQRKRPKVGMSSVNKRIQLLYGEEYGLSVESRIGKGTTVSIKMPLVFANDTKEEDVFYAI